MSVEFGLLNLTLWGYVIATLAMTHVTIASVSIFLHRHQTHRSLSLHPIASHFFRFWLWITTGMFTREWVAVHRKHHATCESDEDPHSPLIWGIWRVLFGGLGLYRIAARDRDTLATYGFGTPEDWLERHVYGAYRFVGIAILLIVDLALFGVPGLLVYLVQMLWIPFWAAGVVNGIGHHWGYRNFATPDASRNIMPLGLLIGGEEFHNNHHAHAYSAKFSSHWWELDISWLYIRILEFVGLAEVKRTARREEQPRTNKIELAERRSDGRSTSPTFAPPALLRGPAALPLGVPTGARPDAGNVEGRLTKRRREKPDEAG